MCLVGFVIVLVMKVKNVSGGMIITILLTTVAGVLAGVTELPERFVSMPAGLGEQFMRIDFLGALDFAYIPFLIALFGDSPTYHP